MKSKKIKLRESTRQEENFIEQIVRLILIVLIIGTLSVFVVKVIF